MSLSARARREAEPYPAANKITLIVAFAPGGIADTLARLIAQGLSERLHQSVVVENRRRRRRQHRGRLRRARRTGRLHAPCHHDGARHQRDAVREQGIFGARLQDRRHRRVEPGSTGDERRAIPPTILPILSRRMNGKTINFAVPGVGTGSHIEAEYFFKFLAKVPAQMIPFQGGAPAINATIGNQVDLMATTLGGGAAAQIAGGKLKGLGIAADKRAAVAPNVPTYAEQGFPGFTAASWVGILRAGQNRSANPRHAQCRDRRHRQDARSADQADRYGLRADCRHAGASRRYVRRRSEEVGRHGQSAGSCRSSSPHRCKWPRCSQRSASGRLCINARLHGVAMSALVIE